MRSWGGPRGFAGRFRTRFRSLRERPLEGRHFRATIVLVAGLALAAAGFAALGPSLGAFTAQVSSNAEVGAGSLDLALNPPSPASSPTSCTANSTYGFSVTCNSAYVTTTAAAPSQSYSADWLASSSGTITPQNDPGFTFTLKPSTCSGTSSTICGDTEATVDELSAEPNMATPSPGYSYQENATSYELSSVSCPSTSICVAVGGTQSSIGDFSGVIVTSSDGGQTWSPPTLITGPLPGTTGTGFYAVSCPSATSCVAVGYDETSSQIEALSTSGTLSSGSWTWTPPSVVSGVSEFLGVSCLTGTADCIAVGDTSASFVALSTTDSGGAWSQPVTLNAAQATASFGNTVTCTGSPSAPTCVALWDPYPASSTTQAVAYVGTGSSIGSLTWSAATFPTAGDVLAGVACPSATSCVVVGSNSGSSPTAGVADTLSISSGSGAFGTTPVTLSGITTLDGVACTSSLDCTAVGNWTSGGYKDDATSATTDGGTTWSPGDQFSTTGTAFSSDFAGLNGVACVSSSTDCSVVGDFGSATSTNSGQSWVGYQPVSCVYPLGQSNNTTCTFSSSDTLASLGSSSTSPLSLQPSTVADPGVLIEVSTELASSALPTDESATARVTLSFEVSS
jgi:hypothetical protein